MPKLYEIFIVSLKLGCTSFGGPTAHLGFFQHEYVQKRKWLTDKEYSNLVALSQFLPGPASSQVGMGIGLLRGGIFGSIVSFLGFTLPSVVLLTLFAYFYMHSELNMGWIHGLKLVAVAIVAQAIWDMSKKLIPSKMHFLIAILSLITVLLWGNPFAQVIVITMAGLLGARLLKQSNSTADFSNQALAISKATGGCLLALFIVLLFVFPLATSIFESKWLMMIEKCYMAGALVFGGGHVVLPLLEAQFVQSGLMNATDFIAGYGLAQAMPGPLFTFVSYIGMVIAGVPGAVIATLAIFLPAFLLIVGAMPFWLSVSRYSALTGAMAGANAAVVGILASAFIHPIVSQTIQSGFDVLIAAIFLWLSIRQAWSPYLLVVMGIIVGFLCY
ncbi:chromate efflux transporter [Lysinibacillus sp. NPDC097195]|uniref:chromate efflux transporter n=1 Tax=Lysinibacillus sp. NPDC097195 TaxID=3364141 RepID=UPI003827F0EF